MEEGVQCNQLATSGWLAPRRMELYWGLSIVLCCWWVRHSAVTVLDHPWWVKGHSLNLCIVSIPATMTTSFMCPLYLSWGGYWQRVAYISWLSHSIYLIVYFLFCDELSLMGIDMWYKDCHTLSLFLYVHLHTSAQSSAFWEDLASPLNFRANRE